MLLSRSVVLALVVIPLAAAQPSPLLKILGSELERNFKVLKEKGDPAPYYLAYSVNETEGWAISATLGALRSNSSDRGRVLDVTVRVGSPKLDNYHRVPGERPQFSSRMPIPIDDVPAAINQRLWRETDRAYRVAAERLTRIRSDKQLKVDSEDDSGDFSQEEPVAGSALPGKLGGRPEQWIGRAREWSRLLSEYPQILTSQVAIVAERQSKYLVNSEGTRLEHGRTFARILISARGKAIDGSDLGTSETFEAEDLSGLPGEATVKAAVVRVAEDLKALLRAPEVNPYVGPAILSGRASAVLFHEIFGHRVEGHRQKDESEGQTFTKSVGAKILPEFLSVIFDPTRRKAEGVDLSGSYFYDDEGVKSRRVAVVEKGVLNTFLMSRTPVRGFARSNGHGRRQPGFEVVGRQSNLFVESSQSVLGSKLREMLVAEIRRQGKEYGLYFKDITGGYTTTARQGVQAFKVVPVLVYRVYADGRPDQLVRGADIVGTPLASFSKIIATSDRAEVFNGFCGAESGSVPVSAISPALLISDMEIQKKEKSNDRPPLLPAPMEGGSK